MEFPIALKTWSHLTSEERLKLGHIVVSARSDLPLPAATALLGEPSPPLFDSRHLGHARIVCPFDLETVLTSGCQRQACPRWTTCRTKSASSTLSRDSGFPFGAFSLASTVARARWSDEMLKRTISCTWATSSVPSHGC